MGIAYEGIAFSQSSRRALFLGETKRGREKQLDLTFLSIVFYSVLGSGGAVKGEETSSQSLSLQS